MKSIFSGYYSLNDQEYEQLWTKSLIVLDTNVLLDLYRIPERSAREFLGALEKIKDKVWVPYQVALEFQRRRFTVIAKEREDVESVLNESRKTVEAICDRFSALQIDKRGLEIDPEMVIKKLKEAISEVVAAVEMVRGKQQEISHNDKIREALDKILENRVGDRPKSQEYLNSIFSEGELRYEKKIPPGFDDINKSKNPNEATFRDQGLEYKREYGDLILWKQTIDKVKKEKIKNVILVTGDRKSDWWWIEKGKTIGPHRELVEELKKEAGVELFWMFNTAKFIENANKYAHTEVSDFSLNELRDAGYMTTRGSLTARLAEELRRYEVESRDIGHSPFDVIVDANERFGSDGLINAEYELDERYLDAVGEYIEDNLGLNIFKKKYGGLWLCLDDFGRVHEFVVYAMSSKKRSSRVRGELIELLSSLDVEKLNEGAVRSNLIVFGDDLDSVYERDRTILRYMHDRFGVTIYYGIILNDSFVPMFTLGGKG